MIRTLLLFAGLSVAGIPMAYGQEPLALEDLSAFADPSPNWQIAGSVQADLTRDEVLSATPGTGILVNLPSAEAKSDLYTILEHQDADVELEFMMARHSNSGIYLQGQYEIQLLDSHGKTTVTYGDCAGIYQRWDESRGAGNEGYLGQAPRVNVAKAPGLWQKLAISFRAARFSPGGEKIENARILSVHLNGQLVHQNVVLTGPTRGSDHGYDIAKGPLRIQGDHGPVAFRNIKISSYDSPPVTHNTLGYEVYTGAFNTLPDFNTLTPVASGAMQSFTSEVVEESDKFIMKTVGMLTFPRSGTYTFDLNTLGNGRLYVDGKEVIPYGWWSQTGKVEVEAGQLPFEFIYHKRDSWYNNGFSLDIAGPGLRSQPLTVLSSMPLGNPVSPIYVDVGAGPRVLRSFIDYHDDEQRRRIPHAISVGNECGLHFTYDPDRAAMVQGWKGDFLDATPMWQDRGDGSSRPRGAVEPMGGTAGLAFESDAEAAWPEEIPAELGYHFLGYARPAEHEENPIFQYQVGEATISDEWAATDVASGLQRRVEVDGEVPKGSLLRIAAGKSIMKTTSPKGVTIYEVDQRYYASIPSGIKAKVVRRGDSQVLVVELSTQKAPITYSLIW